MPPKFLLTHDILPDLDLYDLPNSIPQKILVSYPEVREVSESLAGQHGEWDVTKFFGARAISVETVMKGPEFEANVRLLKRYCDPSLCPRPVLHYKPFDSSPERQITLRGAGASTPLEMPGHAVVQGAWKAPDPAFYDPTTKTMTSGANNREPGRTYDLVHDRVYPPAETGADNTAVNDGDLPAWPIITITGPIEKPLLENVTAERYIVLSANGGLTLDAGEVCVVNMREHTVLVGELGSSAYDKIEFSESQWWGVYPGAQTIRLSGLGSTEDTSIVMTWNDPYL